mgnify:CR=1 FL=1
MHSRILPRMAKPNPLDQLRSLNEIFARAGSSNAEQAEHARKAIDFYGSEQKNNADCNPSLESGAATLAQLHLGQASTSEVAYCHWHIPGTESTSPLWIRQAIVAEMKKLAGRRSALLLVTGLREAICPEGKRWTNARESQFHRVRDWINELACAWASRESKLQVVIL